MKAAVIGTFGKPDVVTIGEASLRPLGPDDALVRVEATGLNPLDLKIIAGYMQQVFPIAFPYVPGTDFSGVIEAVGTQVTRFQPGDRVVGRTAPGAGGALAAHVAIGAADLCAVPHEMSFEQAAALPTAFGTARQALFDVGQLRRGQRVLIHAAAGGVGGMAVQQARHAGAHVIATASSANHALVRELGADEIIDYRTEDFARVRDIDLVLDTMGGETLERSWSVLAPGGRIASLVEFGIEPRNGHAGEFVFFSSATPFLPDAMRLFEAGQLQIVIDAIAGLDEARSALERLATGHVRGKVVVRR
ncbi:NADP-dependent oxidoreductase [Trinickia caryophylli]|uniref:NADPH:quinone reductase n=1 Tax=Trinickia caryophylli TaxID=28094 RepID=A0A1X7CKS4_TRICW|nr:NADP-dependent oxidoreductase [Trinickia caryophylli]PMS09119.1 NADP-dependent oxidoreductase [Trinickia caryophylli]TRX19994.1 NADP-dependent oxidoreductase [Trinickia caryophylli]WQE12665.1 NADP-dependent oxidoreductase [Trinickia caryophylli]SME98164.1 NADPH:quinone reductase [Trinickia caryophylli]GLU30367.1 NADPH:quinone reductase [Trinickia caryophylli]